MSDTLNTARGLKAAGAVLALLVAAALPLSAVAQQAAVHPDMPIGDSVDAMTVVRDADTGKLRAPTAAEVDALRTSTSARRIRASAARPMTKYNANGATGARMTDEMASMAVAVRNDKGGLDMQCVEPGHGADAPHTAASHKPQPVEE
jgi:hypothetical protein